MSHFSSKKKQVPTQDNTFLLQDIHLGIKLKPSKHLSNDRSSPVTKGSNNSSASNLNHKAPSIPTSAKFRVSCDEFPRPAHDEQHSSRPGCRSSVMRASTSSTNVSVNKPPILRPKPKMPASLSSSNSNVSTSRADRRWDGPERTNFKELDNAHSRRVPQRSGVASYATVSRSSGKIFTEGNPELCRGRQRNGSFQQNRLLISGLFDNGQSSHATLRKSSLITLPSDTFDIANLHNNLESLDLQAKNVVNNSSPKERNSHSQDSGFYPQPNGINARRSSKPPPPLPPRGPFIKPDKPVKFQVNVDNVDRPGFEERFRFHNEKDFPKPPAFVMHKKFYPSRSLKNPVIQSYSRTPVTRLVTTV